MDPEVAWQIIVDYINETKRDKTLYVQAAINLSKWIEKGGFAPMITGHDKMDCYIVMAVCDLILFNGG